MSKPKPKCVKELWLTSFDRMGIGVVRKEKRGNFDTRIHTAPDESIRDWWIDHYNSCSQDLKSPVKFIRKRAEIKYAMLMELSVLYYKQGFNIETGEVVSDGE